MTAVYDNHGLRFQYPENWNLQQSQGEDLSIEVVLETPSGAFWLMHLMPSHTDRQAMLKNVVKSLDEQYDGLEVSAVDEDIAEQKISGFDAYFYCFDFLVRANIRTVQTDEFSILLLCQGECREFEKQELVFKAITTSLLSGLDPS